MENVSKRDCSGGGSGGGRWGEMSPEILALVFVKVVPAEEMVRTVSLVCRGWMETVAGPYCWTEIDMEQWCRRRWNTENGSTGFTQNGLIDSVVRKLVRRSKCTFKRLSAYRLGNAGFSYVANCGRCLKVLHIPVSEITDQMVEKHGESLVNLTELDISYCLKITCKGIEAFGKHCKFLIHLKRNMPPPIFLDKAIRDIDLALPNNDSEAFAIAETMSGLRHLELGFGHLGDRGLNAILSKCEALTCLNIQGCRHVELEGYLEKKCEQLMVFKGPWIDEYDTEDCSEDSLETDDDESTFTGSV